MTKKYFNPVIFNKPKDSIRGKKEKPFPAKHHWSPALDEIWDEIGKLETGETRFFKTGLILGKNLPGVAATQRFAQNPSKDNLDKLYIVLPQDFGPAGDYFVKLLKATLEKHNG
ncbi:unnamed protein product [marine sediment metagenome]|uniref:Uncharacterized protein n=1 Tax=marine sediment metagenome TaxID=412755 RepID=X0S7T2_9ZZZZ